MYKLICSFGKVKIFFGQVYYGHLLVPGQVENFTISTPLSSGSSPFATLGTRQFTDKTIHRHGF